MQVINFLSETFGYIGMFQYHGYLDLELYGTLLEGDYCLNWRQNKQANKIEMHLFTLYPDCEPNYTKMRSLLINRFRKSELVDKVVRKGTKRIDIYFK